MLWNGVIFIGLGALKYSHTEKVINSYNEVHTYSVVITLHALWAMEYASIQTQCRLLFMYKWMNTLRSRVLWLANDCYFSNLDIPK